MNQQPPTITNKLTGAALGATLAMLPMALISLLNALGAIKYMGEDIGIIMVILQFVGCIIWAICLGSCIAPAKHMSIPTSGFTAAVIGIIIGGVLQVIFYFVEDLQEMIFEAVYSDEIGGFVIFLLFTCLVNLPIAFGLVSIGKHLPSLKKSKIMYFLLAGFPLIILIFALIIIKNSYSYHAINTFSIINTALLFLFCVTAISGWWGAPSNARELESELQNEDESAIQPTYVEQPASMPTPPPAPGTTYQQNRAPRRTTLVSDEQKKLLLGMTDVELTRIVNNPTLYANPAFVEEARRILTKRQGWEEIKDCSDEQLLDIVHNNVQEYSNEVLDAASMELLTRQNAIFYNEVASMTTEELQGIMSNADCYYDGYIQLAGQILQQRLNPQA